MVEANTIRAKARRAAIRRALYAAYPSPMGAGLIAETLTADLLDPAGGRDRDPLLRSALSYLEDRGRIMAQGRVGGSGSALYRITADGIDHTERELPPEQVRQVRLLRYRVLWALSLDSINPWGLALIGAALQSDSDLDRSDMGIRRALAYLMERGLVAEQGEGGLYRITADGMDYLESDGATIEGVAEPYHWGG